MGLYIWSMVHVNWQTSLCGPPQIMRYFPATSHRPDMIRVLQPEVITVIPTLAGAPLQADRHSSMFVLFNGKCLLNTKDVMKPAVYHTV